MSKINFNISCWPQETGVPLHFSQAFHEILPYYVLWKSEGSGNSSLGRVGGRMNLGRGTVVNGMLES